MKRSSKSLENEFEKPWKIQFQKKENFFLSLVFRPAGHFPCSAGGSPSRFAGPLSRPALSLSLADIMVPCHLSMTRRSHASASSPTSSRSRAGLVPGPQPRSYLPRIVACVPHPCPYKSSPSSVPPFPCTLPSLP